MTHRHILANNWRRVLPPILILLLIGCAPGIQIRSQDLAACDDPKQRLEFDTLLVGRLGFQASCPKIIAALALRGLESGERFACRAIKLNPRAAEAAREYAFNFNILPESLVCKRTPQSNGYDLTCEAATGVEHATLLFSPVNQQTQAELVAVCTRLSKPSATPPTACPTALPCPSCQVCTPVEKPRPVIAPRPAQMMPKPNPGNKPAEPAVKPKPADPHPPTQEAKAAEPAAGHKATKKLTLSIRSISDPPNQIIKLRGCAAEPSFKSGVSGEFTDGPLRAKKFKVAEAASCEVLLSGTVDVSLLTADMDVTLSLPGEP